MSEYRSIKKIIKGINTSDGAGVKLKRILGYNTTKDFDPFLLLDAFFSENPNDYIKGFPWHPHRGIETVTYVLNGSIEHGDSLKNKGIITDGCCQWMTAGSGIIHQEMPKASRLMRGFQLWVNLPSDKKMIQPTYRDIKAGDVTIIHEENAIIRLIAGNYKDSFGPVKGVTINPLFMDIEISPNAIFEYSLEKTQKVFTYIFEGSGKFSNDTSYTQHAGEAVLYNEGEKIKIQSSDSGVRFVLFAGKAINESIAWRGPIVMNKDEELDIAFNELSEGTFIK